MSAAPLWDDFEVPEHARNGRITLNLYDEPPAFVPQRPGAHLRISFARSGLEAGVDRQYEDGEDTRVRLGWGPFAQIYKENDTSDQKGAEWAPGSCRLADSGGAVDD